MFKNKRKYQKEIILKWVNSKKKITKRNLARKINVCRSTLDKFLIEVNNESFSKYGRNYANYRFSDLIRNKIYGKTIGFIEWINKHRKESVFMPTFVTLKPFVDKNNLVSLRTYQNILKEHNFYLPSCNRSTKKLINMRIRDAKNSVTHKSLLKELEEIKIQKKYVKKSFVFGDTVEIDARQHPWYGDGKVHLYRVVDAGSGLVLVEHVEKEEISMGVSCFNKKTTKYVWETKANSFR